MGNMWHSHTEIETIDKLKVQHTHMHTQPHIPAATTAKQRRKSICNCAFRFRAQTSTVFTPKSTNNTRKQPHSSNLIVLCEFCGESRKKQSKTKKSYAQPIRTRRRRRIVMFAFDSFAASGFFLLFQQNLLYRIVLIKALGNTQSTVNLCLFFWCHHLAM